MNAKALTKKPVTAPVGPVVCDNANPPVVYQSAVAPCSVEFERNAKGEPKWTIKAYCEIDELAQCADRVLAIDKGLRAKTTEGADQDGDQTA